MERLEMIENNDYTFDDEHPDFPSLCDHCTEPSEDLEYVESSDESVGFRESGMLCRECRRNMRRKA